MSHKKGTWVWVMKNRYIFGIENKGITDCAGTEKTHNSAFLYRGAGEL